MVLIYRKGLGMSQRLLCCTGDKKSHYRCPSHPEVLGPIRTSQTVPPGYPILEGLRDGKDSGIVALHGGILGTCPESPDGSQESGLRDGTDSGIGT